jgi:hypothetical protein
MLPELSNINNKLGLTEVVVEVASGEVASATEAANTLAVGAHKLVIINDSVSVVVAKFFKWLVMFVS